MASVLVVDDDRKVLEQMNEILSSAGHQVAFTPRPDFVLPRLQNDDFDIILLDVNMPGENGKDLLIRIKSCEQYENLPVIMVTGEDDANLLAECFEAGATDFVEKPFHPQALLSRINAAVHTFGYIRNLVEDLQKEVEEQERTLRLFQKYVPKEVVEKTLQAKETSLFDGELMDVSVLFCDIRGFTSLSEQWRPQDVVSLLNDYYDLMTACVRRYNGTVNQFVGDEVFAVFGAPIPLKKHEEMAVLCAKEMIESLKILNEKYQSILTFPIQVGIGVNSGEVVAGNMGTSEVIRYGVIGDTVNTGKRLEGLTKSVPDGIIISERCFQKISARIQVKKWPPTHLKGKKEPVTVYEVI